MAVFKIKDRQIGHGFPAYIIAEVSCNHEGSFDAARKIIEAAAKAGADAAKIQTYTPDTITRNFKTKPKGTMWEKIDLYTIYSKAYTPWEWHKDLKKVADDCGIDFFSSPFDETAVDHLVEMESSVLKVASFEVVDIKLLQKMAQTGLPIIMSTGMTDLKELEEAIETLESSGTKDLALLHCNSGYPAAFEEANLATIPAMAEKFGCVIGLSDHTLFADHANYTRPMPHITPLEAVSQFGAKIIELHLTLDRAEARSLMEIGQGGFDWAFSREPDELANLISMIRQWEKGKKVSYKTVEEAELAKKTHGSVRFDPTEKEIASRCIRPSLWVVQDIKAGEKIRFAGGKPGNVDSIRPSGGLHIRYADDVNGKKALRDLPAGTPLAWDMIESKSA
jgi:pseudaminic acid synthase